MNPVIDYEFRHLLYNTILLLGGRQDVADLLKKSMDYGVTKDDLEALQRYNNDLITLAKDRLANLTTMQIKPKGEK